MLENDYAKLLIKKRRSLNMTQSEVAIKVGISRTYYTDIENGRSFPSGRTMLKINEVLPIFFIINDANRDYKEA
ncbi:MULTISPECIES: helix-turn-helix domain-containing protein [Staphylococcus]|uniref:Putative transcriptional regulator n=1 Tax=Staphylococcus massiliensis S46 TaxID=1229783 RepID=K9ACU1_9STAP|nr:helix-turn-helix transcriptional regulator [Staphylococcus massiliensis]EKU45048.1 putative transcriptional regulator [Staphylococcus massiliensis S46]